MRVVELLEEEEYPKVVMLQDGYYMERVDPTPQNFRVLYHIHRLVDEQERALAITGIAPAGNPLSGWIFRKNDAISQIERHNSILNTHFPAYKKWVIKMIDDHGV